MKSIAIFSGKGGVGKSTIASLLSLSLAKKHKVVLLDADVTTPSIHVMFGEKEKVGNLHLVSLGLLGNKGTLSFGGKATKRVIKSLIGKVLKIDPDICVLDLPPGTGDVQMSLCSDLKPGGSILVMQSNSLCKADGFRASELFMQYGIPVLGVIENMAGEIFGKSKKENILGYPILESLELNKEIAVAGNSGKMGSIKQNPLDKISDNVFKKISDVKWKIVNKELFEGLSFRELLEQGMMGKYFRNIAGDDVYSNLRFFGLKSWDRIRELITENNLAINYDKFIDENTSERIRRMLNGLDDTNNGMFRIMNVPNTEIPLFPGEVGIAHLYTQERTYYNVPRIEYETDAGNVVLFSHEVVPITIEEVMQEQQSGEIVKIIKSSNPRWLPAFNVMEQIDNAFGNRVGVYSNWKERYKELGIKEEK